LNGQLNLRSNISITNRKGNHIATKKIKTYSLVEMKDKYIGKIGTTDRDEYEYELGM